MSQHHSTLALTPEETQAYQEQGYLVLRDLIEPSLLSKVRGRIEAIAAGAAPLPEGVEKMQEPVVLRGEAQPEAPAGGLRKLEGVRLATDPAINKMAHHPRLLAVMKHLLGEDLKLLRAAAMMKPPKIGSPKGLHQDAAYYPVEPMQHIAAWIALDPATEQNGCMEVLPGSHKKGHLEHEKREYETDVVIKGTTGEEEGLVRLPMQPGDVLLTDCLCQHRSGPNQSNEWRRALILAYMSAKSRYTLPPEELPPWVDSLPISGKSHPGCV
jgi:phytanoyl-CoA hydroxylase